MMLFLQTLAHFLAASRFSFSPEVARLASDSEIDESGGLSLTPSLKHGPRDILITGSQGGDAQLPRSACGLQGCPAVGAQ